MATITIYADKRNKKNCHLRLAINQFGKTAYLSLDIVLDLDQYVDGQVVNHPNAKTLNIYLNKILNQAQETIFINQVSGYSNLSAQQIRDKLEANLFSIGKVTFLQYYENFMNKKSGGTYEVYFNTYNRLKSYIKTDICFEEINKSWLQDFEMFLSSTNKKNSCNIHLRNIRAVFNDAIDNEVTTNYPFRNYKIRPEQTAKRSLSIEDLRFIFFDMQVEEHQKCYLDYFKLIFLLCGINTIDLAHLTEIVNGRIEYRRAKTHKLYSIKVEPEAMEIINRHKGTKYLLDILNEERTDFKSWQKRFNSNLKAFGKVEVGKHGKKTKTPYFPFLSTYWARHTWATIAAQLDIPKETIAKALGHSDNSVTDIYINFDKRKIDEANRQVIDYLFRR
jgi:integrase